MKTLSVIIPIYNEINIEPNIKRVMNVLDGAGIKHEIIMVDDGSKNTAWNEMAALAEKYPNIVFKSTKWNFSEGKPASIEGMLTMKGVTKPVTLTTTKFGCYMSPVFNAQVCGGDFSAKIDRTLWGVDYLVNIGMSKTVDISIQAEAIR